MGVAAFNNKNASAPLNHHKAWSLSGAETSYNSPQKPLLSLRRCEPSAKAARVGFIQPL
ncbi:MAG: hypothetical protein LBV31_02310 [Prevotellaceae bacterium]|nr:hypothetical protein [Prevotellaceae bacterium]